MKNDFLRFIAEELRDRARHNSNDDFAKRIESSGIKNLFTKEWDNTKNWSEVVIHRRRLLLSNRAEWHQSFDSLKIFEAGASTINFNGSVKFLLAPWDGSI